MSESYIMIFAFHCLITAGHTVCQAAPQHFTNQNHFVQHKQINELLIWNSCSNPVSN